MFKLPRSVWLLVILLGLTITRLAQGAGKPPPAGQSVKFAGEVYWLKENVSAPEAATSELREFLRKDDQDWHTYSKMVALRKMSRQVDADAATLARGTLKQVLKQYPESMTKEILMTPKRGDCVHHRLRGDGGAEPLGLSQAK